MPGRQALLQQDRRADQGVAAGTDAGLHRQAEITGFADQPADFAGRLGHVDQQHVPAAGNVLLGIRGSLLVSHGAGAVTSRAAPLVSMERPAPVRICVGHPHWAGGANIRKEPAVASVSHLAPIHLGLDVHKDTISVGVLEPDQQIPEVERGELKPAGG